MTLYCNAHEKMHNYPAIVGQHWTQNDADSLELPGGKPPGPPPGLYHGTAGGL